jgi:hypothetical protein
MQKTLPAKKILVLALVASGCFAFGSAMAAPSVIITSPVAGQEINPINQKAFPLYGTCSAPGQDVQVTLAGGTASAIGHCEADGFWSAAIDLTAPADGAQALNVSHADGLNGNAQASVSLTKNTSAANRTQVDCASISQNLPAPWPLPYIGNTYDTLHGPYARNQIVYNTSLTNVGPLNDILNLGFPQDLPNQTLLGCGYIDVTQAPYNADPSGQTDSTVAINAAMKKAYESQLATYLPPGNYKVSDTLECVQGYYVRSSGSSASINPNYTKAPQADISGCTLVGSRSGPQRARIFLAPNSTGFADLSNWKQKAVIHIWARAAFNKGGDPTQGESDIAFNDTISNIDVHIGGGNPGAIGVWFPAAQGSGVSEMTINATNGYSGMLGGIGAGGGVHGVKVIGGQFGLDFNALSSESQPAPTVSDIELTGQTVSAIRYQGLGTLTVVGSKITVPTNATGPAVLGYVWSGSSMSGYVNIVDSQIIFPASGAKQAAVVGNRATYLKNTYIQNAAWLFGKAGWDGGVAPKTITNVLAGNASGWSYIKEYAQDINPPSYTTTFYDQALGKSTNLTNQYLSPVYLDGVAKPGPYSAAPVTNAAPPLDHLSQHRFASGLVDWATPGTVNVKQAPYYAKGDGVTDDTAAIQAALDQHQNVFIPRGMYRITETLHLAANSKLFGVSNSVTTLFPEGAKFTNQPQPVPLIETVDSASAAPVLSSLQLYVPLSTTSAYALNWRSGSSDASLSDVMFRLFSKLGFVNSGVGVPLAQPLVKISGNGGGKWYNFVTNQYTNCIWGSWALNGNFRQLLITGTTQPLRMYQVDVEYSVSDAMLEIQNARNVDIYGLKSEGNFLVLWVRNSDQISLYGHGGNGTALPNGTQYYPAGFAQYLPGFVQATPSIYRVENTPNFRFVNSVDQGNMTSSAQPSVAPGGAYPSQVWYTPDHWSFINDLTGGAQVLSKPLERPVLYMRGSPN